MGKWKINRKKKMVRIIILITASVFVFLFFVFNALNSACVVYVLLFFMIVTMAIRLLLFLVMRNDIHNTVL